MAAITYDAPSQQVPTADNIMVDVNLSITFRLTDEDSAYKFVYLIGVSRFNSYLSTKVEEAIRGLVRGVTHNKVNDLREEFAIGMISNLNNKLNGFGIRVMSVKITDVRLPQQLQDRLEKTTSFKTRIEEEEKAQENRKRSLTDEAEKKLTAIVQTNHRKIQELTAECVKFEIQMTEMQAASRGGSQVFEVQARSNMDVALTKARGALTAGKSKGQREAEDMVRQAAILSDQRKTKVNQDCQTMVLGSEGRLASARATAQSMIASAEAEFAGAQKLKEKRRIELEWQRLDALQVLASKGKRLLTGDIGCRILNEMAAVQVGDNMHK